MNQKLFFIFIILFILISILLWVSLIPLVSSFFFENDIVNQITTNVNKKYNYGAIIDAGSSGSRLFLYTWPTHNISDNDLLHITPMLDSNGRPISKKVTPGLSSYSDKSDDAVNYIKLLFDFAAKSIPKNQHKETPFYLLATAGMRMVSKEAQVKIFDNIRIFAKTHYDFLFSDSHAKVISGSEEGIYGWITTNYLLNRFNRNHMDMMPLVKDTDSSSLLSQTSPRQKTVGVIDMGGGSMQIAYELGVKSNPDSKLINTVNLGYSEKDTDNIYKLFVTTFLGFGANIARTRYERMLVKDTLNQMRTNDTQSFFNMSMFLPEKLLVEDPCLHPGLELESPTRIVNDSQGGLHLNTKQIKKLPLLNATFKGTGLYSECKIKIRVLLDNKPCLKSNNTSLKCSMGGRLHPQLDLVNMQFYGFSEFWYSMNDVFELGGVYNYFKLHFQAEEHCKENWFSIILKQKKGAFKNADWPRLRYQCFKTAWITAVLHDGLGFPITYDKFTSVTEIKGAEVQWSLGALLYQTRFLPLRLLKERRDQDLNVVLKKQSSLSYIHAYLLFLASIIIAVVLMWIHTRQHWSRFMGK